MLPGWLFAIELALVAAEAVAVVDAGPQRHWREPQPVVESVAAEAVAVVVDVGLQRHWPEPQPVVEAVAVAIAVDAEPQRHWPEPELVVAIVADAEPQRHWLEPESVAAVVDAGGQRNWPEPKPVVAEAAAVVDVGQQWNWPEPKPVAGCTLVFGPERTFAATERKSPAVGAECIGMHGRRSEKALLAAELCWDGTETVELQHNFQKCRQRPVRLKCEEQTSSLLDSILRTDLTLYGPEPLLSHSFATQ